MSLVLGFGLEHSCPWPRECLSSALASDYFCECLTAAEEWLAMISECLTAAEEWLAINNLKLKSNKTQCIIFSRKLSKSAIAFSKAVNQDSHLDFLDSVKNLGFFLDSNLTIEHQIKHVVKKRFFHIRNIGKIRKFLTVESCKVLVNSLVISQLDYCNSIYYGLPSYLILRLQRVQNTAPD